jgi:hypothetical protein
MRTVLELNVIDKIIELKKRGLYKIELELTFRSGNRALTY